MMSGRSAAALVAAVLAAPAPGFGQAPTGPWLPGNLAPAAERVGEYVSRHMASFGTPGVALAVVDVRGSIHDAAFGYANLEARLPVTTDTRFQIGSISKSFTAVAALQLHREGRLPLDRPLRELLPWFRPPAGGEGMTVHHLLTHTSGLPRDRDDLPTSPFRVLGAGELVVSPAPGERQAYSNIGYQILGYALDELEGMSYARIITERILGPLGMDDSEPVITHASRLRLAVGYQPLYDDRPAHRSHPLVPAPWIEYGDADGSIVSTARDLAAYLRMLLARGRTDSGRLLDDVAFDLLTQRTVPTGEDVYYGYGLAIDVRNGREVIAHGGGMIGYSAYLVGDLRVGLGVVVLTNGPGNPAAIADFALDAVRAGSSGAALPEVPEPPDPLRIASAAEYAGGFRTADGRSLVLGAEGDRLWLERGGERFAVEARGRDTFYVDHPEFRLFLARARREDGRVAAITHGADRYGRLADAAAAAVPSPGAGSGVSPGLAAYPGHYRAQNPWFRGFRVVAREGRLWLMMYGGGEQELFEVGPGEFRPGGDERSPERLRFDADVGGRTLRATLGGVAFYRTFTP